MIKYFCDRCNSEMSAYTYNNSAYAIQIRTKGSINDGGSVALSEKDPFCICSSCYADFRNFICGKAVRGITNNKKEENS